MESSKHTVAARHTALSVSPPWRHHLTLVRRLEWANQTLSENTWTCIRKSELRGIAETEVARNAKLELAIAFARKNSLRVS
jgi:hypothetical protein